MAVIPSTLLEGVVEGLRLRPGDSLVLRVHPDVTGEQIVEFYRLLSEAMPDTQCVIVGGPVEQLAVVEGGAGELAGLVPAEGGDRD